MKTMTCPTCGRSAEWASLPPSVAEASAWLADHGDCHPATREPSATFTCPRCGRTSHNPNDARWGYCGACHDWTGEPQPEVVT